MSRKLTTYKQASILEQIEQAPEISVLAGYRNQIGVARLSGQLQPSEKTMREWTAALWQRVVELMRAAQTPEQVTFIFNATLGWPKPHDFALALESICFRRCAELPSPAERLKAQGVVIAGITG